jgi:hypothetical protein
MNEINNESRLYRSLSGLQQLAFATAAIGGLICSVAVAAAGDEVASVAVPSTTARGAIVQREATQNRPLLAVDRAIAMPLPVEKAAAGAAKVPAREAERIHEGHRKLRPNASDATEQIATF